MPVSPPPMELGIPAPNFTLPATDGQDYSLGDIMGPNGAVVVFICNHCPYVKAVIDRIVSDAKLLAEDGIGFVAISSNDVVTYPDDSFDNMKLFARDHGFPFPYLYDETQDIAHAYDAACTPDFFGLNAKGEIVYRGRLDEGRTNPLPPGAKRELLEGMRLVAKTGKGPADQIPSVGCSMKWKKEEEEAL